MGVPRGIVVLSWAIRFAQLKTLQAAPKGSGECR